MTNQRNGSQVNNPYTDNGQYNFGEIFCREDPSKRGEEVNHLNGNSFQSDLLPATEKAVIAVKFIAPWLSCISGGPVNF